VRLGWALVLGVIAVGEFAYDYRPHLNIETAELGDESDPLSAFFRIKNVGRVNIEDIVVSCKIFEGTRLLLAISGSTEEEGKNALLGQAPIKELAPDEFATRDCLANQNSDAIRLNISNPSAIRIDITAQYHWPIIGRNDSVTRHFSTRTSKGGSKYFLVPDVEH